MPKKIGLFIALVIAVGLLSLLALPSARAVTTSPGVDSPRLYVAYNTTGYISYDLAVDHNYDVYLVTEINCHRFLNNLSYAYIESLSIVNASGETNIHGYVAPGAYYLIVSPYQNSTVTIYEASQEAPPAENTLQIPWDIIVIIAATAIVTAIATTAINKKWISIKRK